MLYYNNHYCHFIYFKINGSCYIIMNRFEVIDEYGYNYDNILYKVIKKALKFENVKSAIFTIIFVDEQKIQELNKNYRSLDKVTDVISFAYEDNEVKKIGKIRVLGEIFVCIPRMKEQAKEYNHSETRELCFLCIHGLFHLLGYDHQTKEEEKIMFDHQERVLDEYNKTKKPK